MSLQTMLEKYIFSPYHPESNFDIAYEFEKIGQTAAAIGFYLSCADKTTSDVLVYECLLRMAKCYNTQKGRAAHEENSLLMAAELLPERPEAYHALAIYYEGQTSWKQSLLHAGIGMKHTTDDNPSLYTDVGYPGRFSLEFQQAVALWWVGRFTESRALFREVLKGPELSDDYIELVEYNINQLVINGKLDIVLQGPYSDTVLETAYHYLQLPFVNDIVISCWEDDEVPVIDHTHIHVVQSAYPASSGTGNRNLQLVSSLAGVKQSCAQYVAKMRNDQRYDLDSMTTMNEYFNDHCDDKKINYEHNKDKPNNPIFVAGYFKDFPFHPRDHLFWGHRCDLIDLFSCPLEAVALEEKLNIKDVSELSHMYDCFVRTESYIGTHYCSNFDTKIKKMLLSPDKYLYDDAPLIDEAMKLSKNLSKKVFKSFPRKGIDLEWFKYGWDTYKYENQKKEFSERWAEDGY